MRHLILAGALAAGLAAPAEAAPPDYRAEIIDQVVIPCAGRHPHAIDC